MDAKTMRTDLVICESADGWSLHAPGSTDEAIACGDAPALVTGPWTDDEHTIPAEAIRQAEAIHSREALRRPGLMRQADGGREESC